MHTRRAVKIGQLSVVYSYRTLDVMTKKIVISEKLHFHYLGE